MSNWTNLPLLSQDVRDYLNLEGTTGRYSDALLSSNIRAAASFLEKATSRVFEKQDNVTYKFTTEGRAYQTIPDTRSVNSLTLQSATLLADQTYWLIPDADHPDIFTGLQFRAFGRGDSYLANPEWFDRNLDVWAARGYRVSSLPNDLVVSLNVGYDPYPYDFLHAVKVLAAFYTKRPASVLADAAVTPEGNELRYSQLPVECRNFIEQWQAGTQVVVLK